MTTIDELGRLASAGVRADAADMAAARVESGLERLRLDIGPIVTAPRRGRDPRRWITIGVAAALVAAAVVALVVNANEKQAPRFVPSTEVSPTQATTPPTQQTSPPTTVADTELPATTQAPAVVPADAISVAHDALPPAYPARAFASVDAPADPTRLRPVAIGESRIVIVDSDTATATLIDLLSPDSPPQQVPLSAAPVGYLATGPGDVLYGVVQGTDPLMSLVAIALSGDRAGQVLASAPIGAAAFAEAPVGVLGHGPDGIIDRRTGNTLLGYVDATGAPTSLGRPAHSVGIIAGDMVSGDPVIRDPDGAHDWPLVIERDPSYPGSYTGEIAGAPSSHGGAVVWTAVGPPDNSSADVPSPTEPVVAVLAADGTGTWYQLVDGWQVAASDLDGTILQRRVGDKIELARLDPPQRFDYHFLPAAPHQRLEFAATLPTTLTTATPCTIGDLALEPAADGAMGTVYGGLWVRNKADQPCQISGVPDVAFLDDAGNVVQSTDPALLTQPAAVAIVLEHDSSTAAQLGAIASNVCGGNESSQFRLTVGGQSQVVPFAVGRPFDPQQCDPSNNQSPTPGALAAQPFDAVQPNPDVANPFDSLDVTLEVPPTVRVGDVLRYDVVVSARTDPQVISTDNCPIYSETLGFEVGQFLLNCNGTDGILISPGDPVRFHIELPISPKATLGPATLSWTPIEPTGPTVTAAVTIIA